MTLGELNDGAIALTIVTPGSLAATAGMVVAMQLRLSVNATGTDAGDATSDTGTDGDASDSGPDSGTDAGPPPTICPSPGNNTFVVTTADDELDSPGGATLADMGGAADLSLREAIVLSAITPQLDNILFDPAVFPVGGGVTIDVAGTALPPPPGDTCIDGTMAGVVLDGTNLMGALDGLSLDNDNNFIAGIVIQSFPDDGIRIGGDAAIVSGCVLLSNGDEGLSIEGGDGSFVGPGNVFGTNATSGIRLGFGATNATIRGNYLGTDPAGTMLPNGSRGLVIAGGSTGVVVGGPNPGDGNVIGFNLIGGIGLSDAATTGNTIEGNFIGTFDASFVTPMGNGATGVRMDTGTSNNIIRANVIGFNSGPGILADGMGTTGNTFTANLIAFNTGVPINVFNGANNMVMPPAITSADATGVAGTAPGTGIVELFCGTGSDPTVLLDLALMVSGGGSWSSSADPTGCGALVLATFTDSGGNTSIVSGGFPAP